MSIARSSQPPSPQGELEVPRLSDRELVAEARCGTGLARALVEHILRMQVTGYSDEIVVGGQVWRVSVQRTALPS